MYITNENDIYSYFYVINDINPNSVLDVGMFLMRVGAISRSAKGETISTDIKLDALEISKVSNLSVYDKVYDVIYDHIADITNKYELAVVLRLDEYISKDQTDMVWHWLGDNVKYVFTDCESDKKYDTLLKMGRLRDIILDGTRYVILINEK